uniref:Uncharacterized protein n=1 Tax=Glossina morsitans morsitans TaxID=37546 RepID=A0A1B0G3I5_GLOMM
MPFLEDSGIESEDKPSLINEDNEMLTTTRDLRLTNETSEHMADLEVVFKGSICQNTQLCSTMYKASKDMSIADHRDSNSDIEDHIQRPNTCRILQRKLELKVERAKRNYNQYQEENKRKSQSSTLIPISRLPIPGESQHKPLVDYNTESDDGEEVSFFPHNEQRKQRMNKKCPELSDTFSIQEMIIDSDLESNDSQNLELLTPRLKKSFIDQLSGCFCFSHNS